MRPLVASTSDFITDTLASLFVVVCLRRFLKYDALSIVQARVLSYVTGVIKMVMILLILVFIESRNNVKNNNTIIYNTQIK